MQEFTMLMVNRVNTWALNNRFSVVEYTLLIMQDLISSSMSMFGHLLKVHPIQHITTNVACAK